MFRVHVTDLIFDKKYKDCILLWQKRMCINPIRYTQSS